MITPSELDVLRQAATQALPDKATIERFVRTKDGLDWIEEWVLQGVYPCRIAENKTAREYVVGGQVQSSGDQVVRLPYGTDVTESDRLVINGRTLNIIRVLTNSYATTTSLMCQEVR